MSLRLYLLFRLRVREFTTTGRLFPFASNHEGRSPTYENNSILAPGRDTGGNENLRRMGVAIAAQNELQNRLMHPAPAAKWDSRRSHKEGGAPIHYL
jgi:hypothetical protein